MKKVFQTINFGIFHHDRFSSLSWILMTDYSHVIGLFVYIASWEFINSTSNWIASAEENDMELYIQGGELRGSIIGSLPHIDSPRLSIDTSVGHSVVIRMMYTGQGEFLF